MGDYLIKAVEIGKEATAIGIRAGGAVFDKTKDIKTSMGGGAKFFEEADERDMEIKKLLDGNNDRQKLEGMKKLIAVRESVFFSLSLLCHVFNSFCKLSPLLLVRGESMLCVGLLS